MRPLIFLFSCLLFFSCKTNRTINNEREGLWIEKNKIDTVTYKSKGRYRNGFERKTWRYYENRKLVKKEIYKDSICRVTHFKNGKKLREGQTKMRVTETELRWFYFGDWKEYDASGKLIAIDHYVNGELMHSTEFTTEDLSTPCAD